MQCRRLNSYMALRGFCTDSIQVVIRGFRALFRPEYLNGETCENHQYAQTPTVVSVQGRCSSCGFYLRLQVFGFRIRDVHLGSRHSFNSKANCCP